MAPIPTSADQFKRARRPTTLIPQSLIDGARLTERQPWNTDKHLKYIPPTKVYTMQELGLDGSGISETAISDPFQLFSEEAILQMRAEVFSQPILDNCQYTSSFISNLIRGHCPEYATFCTNAWYDPQTLEAISQVAGIDLVPAWDHDVANVNVSLDSPEATKDVAFGWHYDSVPFVCITMLSDCTDMIGGETLIRTGDGGYMKMRGPAMGTAVVMQGRYIEHQALKAHGGRERISMICSLRPRNPMTRDESTLVGVRGISNLTDLYYQYTAYRVRNLEERMKEQRKRLDTMHVQKSFDLVATRQFLLEQREYIDRMLEDLVEIG